ncbi:MAG: Tetrahydrofolate dehydrogenase/cyclohydrolase, catalytic domain [Planctomycetota bacterium]
MTAQLIDGKLLSATVRESLIARIKAAGRPVRLDAVLVGSDRAAAIYAENQAKTCTACPMARATTTSRAASSS